MRPDDEITGSTVVWAVLAVTALLGAVVGFWIGVTW